MVDPYRQDKNLPLILHVENDQPSVDITKYFLKDICEVDYAENASKALELVKKKYYKAILMDINLGREMNGIELTGEIRKINGYEKIPIVALTAYALMGDKEKCLAAGCSHYISKPFEKTHLIKLMTDILQ